MQLEQIAAQIVNDNPNYMLLTGREGIGKSFLSILLYRLIYGKNKGPIVVLCKTYDQVDEKHDWFMKFDPTLNIQIAKSPGQKVKDENITPYYKTRSISNLIGDLFNREKTIENCTNQHDIEFVEQATTDIFRSDVHIIISVIAQHSQVHNLEKAFVFIDDPHFEDVNENVWIKNPTPQINSTIIKMGLQKFTSKEGQEYVIRPDRFSLKSKHPTIFSTTELLTQKAIIKNFNNITHHVIKKDMPSSNIKIIFSHVVNSNYGHNCIPLAVKEANLNGSSGFLVGDGMLKVKYNHTTIKGRNDLKDSAIVVDMSYLHPEVSTEIQIEFPDYDRLEINNIFLIDQLHQALGRNQGHRYNGAETIVIANPNFSKLIEENLEYNYIPIYPANIKISNLLKKAGFELLPLASNSELFKSIYNLCIENFMIERTGDLVRFERTKKCFIVKWLIRKTNGVFNILDLLTIYDQPQLLDFINEINLILKDHIANKDVETVIRKRKKIDDKSVVINELEQLNELIKEMLLLANNGSL